QPGAELAAVGVVAGHAKKAGEATVLKKHLITVAEPEKCRVVGRREHKLQPQRLTTRHIPGSAKDGGFAGLLHAPNNARLLQPQVLPLAVPPHRPGRRKNVKGPSGKTEEEKTNVGSGARKEVQQQRLQLRSNRISPTSIAQSTKENSQHTDNTRIFKDINSTHNIPHIFTTRAAEGFSRLRGLTTSQVKSRSSLPKCPYAAVLR
ncbi:hypothetical protein EJB05_30954, partial [Eragrostis curvula]